MLRRWEQTIRHLVYSTFMAALRWGRINVLKYRAIGEEFMQVAIDLPEDIAEGLRAKWKDLPRHALEALALEDYRSGELTESQVRRVLGFKTRLEVNSFLRDHGLFYDYSPSEIDLEIKTNERLLQQKGRERRSR
jgi:hypothetical protein